MHDDRPDRERPTFRTENLLAWILVGVVAGMVIGAATDDVGITIAISIGACAVISVFVDLPALLRGSGRR